MLVETRRYDLFVFSAPNSNYNLNNYFKVPLLIAKQKQF
jgi:hypothetical protein